MLESIRGSPIRSIRGATDLLGQLMKDLRKYKDYLSHNIRVNLKLKVSNTMLGYLWWLLDPLLQMMIYSIVVVFIFQRGQPNFPVFVFCALLSWKWFNSTIMYSSTCIKSNLGILNQVYLPKFILPLQETIVNLIKYLFGFIILVIMLAIYRIAPTIHFFEVIIVIAINFLFVFAVSVVVAHYGVYLKDLKNLLSHFLRIWWYLSPGIYSMSLIPEQYRWIFWFNPNTALFESYRNVIMYGKSPMYGLLLIWGVISVIIIVFGLKKLYKFDRTYSKVV